MSEYLEMRGRGDRSIAQDVSSAPRPAFPTRSIEGDLDIDALRAGTPGVAHCVHLNSAGAGLMSRQVLSTVIDHLELETRHGCYEAADAAKTRLDGVYASVARLIGCRPEEIAVLESASRAWALFFASLEFAPGDVILSTEGEYASNFMCMLQVRSRLEVQLEIIAPGPDGMPDPDHLDELLKRHGEKVRLVSLTHAATNNGAIVPVRDLADVVRAAREAEQVRPDTIIAVDACQTIGQIAFSVEELGCDVLTATSRKFLRGPRGIGVLYLRGDGAFKDTLIEPRILDVRSAMWTEQYGYSLYAPVERFETWDKCVATKLGFGAAIDEALTLGLPAIEARITALGCQLRTMLRGIPGIHVADNGSRHGGTTTFKVDGHTPEELIAWLRPRGINIGLADLELVRLDAERRALGTIARCSAHYYNTQDELIAFGDALRQFVREA